MSKWQQVKLGELCSKIGSGATPKGGATVYVEKGTSLIRSQNVYNLRFEYSGLTFIADDAAKKLSGVTIHPDDVLLNITGDSVARTCIVPANVIPARVNQHVAILRTKQDILNPKYLNYFLASPQMQAHMLGLAVGKGASRNAMTKSMIENFEIPLPPIEVQRKIADVLSAYDDLIENNRKQIKLLEEAAQRLYKEWFIDLRFPDYETTPIIDGIPSGWEKKKIEDICPIMTGKRDANFGCSSGQYLFFTCSQEPIKSASYSFNTSAVILAGNGDFNVKLYRGKFEAYQRTYVLSPKNVDMIFLLYGTVQTNMRELTQKASGSTIKFLTRGMIANIEILVPHYSLLTQYNNMNNAIQTKIEKLKKSVQSAIEIRDRLLPKLMTGEII